MKYVTTIEAIDPKDGKLKLWAGPLVEADNYDEARKFCDNNELGYCKIIFEAKSVNVQLNLN